MCGRFSLTVEPDEIVAAFNLDRPLEHLPRYNIAPSQPIITIVVDSKTGAKESRLMLWGLIPSWSKDPSKFLINARAETVHQKPSFKSALKRRRCLIPADGFYEWQQGKGSKQPFYFSLSDGHRPLGEHRSIFAFAGLWESYLDLETCTIITTTANSLLAPVHDRMPVILTPEQYDRWLDPRIEQSEVLLSLLKPYPPELMQAVPVSRRVNAAQFDDPSCIEPLEGQEN
jgi:putative SOS response-associated peptidase YedK